MEFTVGNTKFELKDTILKKEAHAFYKLSKREGLDEIEMMDEILKIVTVSANGEISPEAIQAAVDLLEMEDYKKLAERANEVIDAFVKKNQN